MSLKGAALREAIDLRIAALATKQAEIDRELAALYAARASGKAPPGFRVPKNVEAQSESPDSAILEEVAARLKSRGVVTAERVRPDARNRRRKP